MAGSAPTMPRPATCCGRSLQAPASMRHRPPTLSTASNTSSSALAGTPRSTSSAVTTSSRSPSTDHIDAVRDQRTPLDSKTRTGMTNAPSFSRQGNIRPMSQVSGTMRCKFALPLVFLLLMRSNALATDAIEEKAKVCTACHGETGVPQLKTTPVIWGQNAGYLFLQLRDFQSGARKNDLMSPIAATLAREDLLPLAEYFAKLKWPTLQQPPASQDVATKAQAAISSVGCIGCHL